MKNVFYTLTKGQDHWQVMLLKSTEEALGIIKLIEKDDEVVFWDKKEDIPFLLVGTRTFDLSTEEHEELGVEGFLERYPYGKRIVKLNNGEEFENIINWGNNIGLEYNTVSEPDSWSARCRIISPKVKEVFTRFNIPEHCFYPITITHELTGEKREYYLFHLLRGITTYYEKAYWPVMKSKYIHEPSGKIIREFPMGTMKTYEEFIALGREEDKKVPEEDIWDYDTKVPYLVYQEPYDMVGYGPDILVSEKLAKALEKEVGEGWCFDRMENKVITGFTPEDTLPFNP